MARWFDHCNKGNMLNSDLYFLIFNEHTLNEFSETLFERHDFLYFCCLHRLDLHSSMLGHCNSKSLNLHFSVSWSPPSQLHMHVHAIILVTIQTYGLASISANQCVLPTTRPLVALHPCPLHRTRRGSPSHTQWRSWTPSASDSSNSKMISHSLCCEHPFLHSIFADEWFSNFFSNFQTKILMICSQPSRLFAHPIF